MTTLTKTSWIDHQIVFANFGEIHYTKKTPYMTKGAFDNAGKDINHIANYIVSHDNWQHTTDKRYELRTISLPSGLSPESYIYNFPYWDSLFLKLRGSNLEEIPFSWMEKLLKFSEVQLDAAFSLLKVKSFRSEFRKSLRNQLEVWLDQEEPKFASPFSIRQWGSLTQSLPRRYYR